MELWRPGGLLAVLLGGKSPMAIIHNSPLTIHSFAACGVLAAIPGARPHHSPVYLYMLILLGLVFFMPVNIININQ